MKAHRVCFVIAATLLLAFPTFSYAATPRTLVAKVERVSDGDTIMAMTFEWTKLRIRLLGIDAPEVPRSTIQARPSERFE